LDHSYQKGLAIVNQSFDIERRQDDSSSTASFMRQHPGTLLRSSSVSGIGSGLENPNVQSQPMLPNSPLKTVIEQNMFKNGRSSFIPATQF
jgi:hypothetical protein